MKKTLFVILGLMLSLASVAQEVMLLQENFNKFTAGSEQYPDRSDLCLKELNYCINPSLLQTPGWGGGGIYQAGGCAYIYGFYNDLSSQYELGYLESPHFDASGNMGEFVVRFRARTVLEQDWLGVCGVPSEGQAQQKFAVIGQNWGWFEVTLQCGDADTYLQFEPLEDGCYIDDISVVRLTSTETDPQYKLPTPETLPVEDYSAMGYTARWKSVAEAEDYAVYDYLYHTARTNGEPFYYIDTDFSSITQGTEANPVAPGNDMDFGMYLDDYVGRADWLAHMPMFAGGCLAVDNSFYNVMESGLESPALQLAAPGKDLNISLRVMSPTLKDLTLYVYGRTSMIDVIPIEMTPEWTTQQITIPACEDGVSLCFIVDDREGGYAYFDDLRVWQNLPAGTIASVPVGYYETAATSLYIPTPSTPADYRHAFSVSAYQYEYDSEGDIIDYDMSAWSAPVFADGLAPEGIRTPTQTPNLDGKTPNLDGKTPNPLKGGSQSPVYDLEGKVLSTQILPPINRGLQIRNGKKWLR